MILVSKFAFSNATYTATAWGSQQGSWNPYPIDMKFVTPCMVDSHIGMSQAGAAGGGAQFDEGVQCGECANHLHQLHVCVPSVAGRTRLLYRMSLDFADWAKYVPGIELVWTEMANQVLGEVGRCTLTPPDP